MLNGRAPKQCRGVNVVHCLPSQPGSACGRLDHRSTEAVHRVRTFESSCLDVTEDCMELLTWLLVKISRCRTCRHRCSAETMQRVRPKRRLVCTYPQCVTGMTAADCDLDYGRGERSTTISILHWHCLRCPSFLVDSTRTIATGFSRSCRIQIADHERRRHCPRMPSRRVRSVAS